MSTSDHHSSLHVAVGVGALAVLVALSSACRKDEAPSAGVVATATGSAASVPMAPAARALEPWDSVDETFRGCAGG